MKIRSNPRFQGHKPRQADFVPYKTEIETIQGLESIREKIQTCIQCGTCTGSCPNADAMDLTPRHLWRLVIMGKTRQIFESRTFDLCSACYCCTLRCPRGLALTDAMAQLKQVAAAHRHPADYGSKAFYNMFLQCVRRYGRIQETRLMTRYLTAMALKNPLFPFRFTSLGLRMAAQGKLKIRKPAGERNLEKIFRKTLNPEDRP